MQVLGRKGDKVRGESRPPPPLHTAAGGAWQGGDWRHNGEGTAQRRHPMLNSCMVHLHTQTHDSHIWVSLVNSTSRRKSGQDIKSLQPSLIV